MTKIILVSNNYQKKLQLKKKYVCYMAEKNYILRYKNKDERASKIFISQKSWKFHKFFFIVYIQISFDAKLQVTNTFFFIWLIVP